MTEEAYRPGAGIVLVNDKKHVFAAKRLDSKSLSLDYAWQMPQGGIDAKESPYEAAVRELKEETSIKNAQLICGSSDWFYYDLPEHIQKTFWGGRYLGQRQKWFLMRYLGEDKDICLDTPHPEFSEWQWMDKNKVIESIVPFKKQLYQDIFNEFSWYFKP